MNTPRLTAHDKNAAPWVAQQTFDTPKRQVHKFNEIIARCYHSISAAVIFEYFKFRNLEDGWKHKEIDPETGRDTGTVLHVYRTKQISLTDLERQYRYMGREEIRLAVKRLLRGDDKSDMPPLLLRRKIPCTQYYKYRVREDAYWEIPDLSEGKLHRFEPKIAGELGIIPAIVFENIRYHVLANWDAAAEKSNDDYFKTRDRADHYIAPRAWQERHHYVSLSTAERAFQIIERSGYIVRKGVRFGRVPIWTLRDKDMEEYAAIRMKSHPDYNQKRIPGVLEDSDL